MKTDTVIPLSLLIVATLTILPLKVSSNNILFFHCFVTSSHRTAIWPLAEKLADNGHNVTYIFPMINKIGYHPKIEEVTPSKMIPILTEVVGDFDINLRLQNKEMEWLNGVMNSAIDLCEAFYDSPEVQEWLTRPDLHYDLIFIDSSLGECGYGLVHKFNSKMIHFMPTIPPFLFDSIGIVPESSSIPDMFTNTKPDEMTLYRRILSTLVPLLWYYKYQDYAATLDSIVWEKLNMTNDPDNPPPSIHDIEKETNLVMISGHFIEEYPMALPPMFVSFSGLWCSKDKLKERKPLPENLEKFIEKSDGFFYVSFGSAVVASGMPIELRNQFFQTFRKFPKYRFLWRWTGPVPEDTPENAMLLSWYPQHDVLAHPKIKGFLTQTGRPSTQEALCHGAPLITVPIFADQGYNADRLEYIGAAIKLNIDNLTESSLTAAFNEILQNPKHSENGKRFSAMFRDRPLDPLENAFYWTEYTLRHSKEDLALLKPLGLRQTWYQRRLLDVYFLLAVIILGFISIILVSVILTCKLLSKVFLASNPKGKMKRE